MEAGALGQASIRYPSNNVILSRLRSLRRAVGGDQTGFPNRGL